MAEIFGGRAAARRERGGGRGQRNRSTTTPSFFEAFRFFLNTLCTTFLINWCQGNSIGGNFSTVIKGMFTKHAHFLGSFVED